MKPKFFAARSLFFTIFLWFFAAQLLIGAALYALAAATERSYDRGTFELAGGYIEARAQAAAIAYELGGGVAAAREAWKTPTDAANERGGRRGRGERGGRGARKIGVRRRSTLCARAGRFCWPERPLPSIQRR